MKIETIEKYDTIVRKKYLTAEIRKVNENKIIWIENGERVANLTDSDGYEDFSFEYDFK